MSPEPTADTPAVDPSLDADARSLRRAMGDLIRLVQFRDRDRICCHDVSVSQCHALEGVLRRGPLRLGDLAAHLYLDKSTTSRVVDGLIAKGYAERRRDPDDGRAVLLHGTEAGRALFAKIDDDLHAETMAVLEGLAPEARRALPQLLVRLVRAKANRMGVSCDCCGPDEADGAGNPSQASCIAT
ncbi:MAG: MarR family transcriptional regulator [Acidobacteriota bacterium]